MKVQVICVHIMVLTLEYVKFKSIWVEWLVKAWSKWADWLFPTQSSGCLCPERLCKCGFALLTDDLLLFLSCSVLYSLRCMIYHLKN